MPWATFAIPALMATVGAGALVTTVVLPDDKPPAGASRVWIDGPSGESALPPGMIPVTAHATADDTITGLDLYVDGKKVTNDKTLVRNEKLFYGGFTWDADVGKHKLVVQQVGGTGKKSFIRVIVISEDAPKPTTTLGPRETTTTRGPDETTTTRGPDETTTTLGSDEITTTAPGPDETTTTAPGPDETTTPAGTTTAPPEGNDTVPGTSPTQPTTPIPEGPIIDGAILVGQPADRVTVSFCDDRVEVQARVRNADYVQVIVRGTGLDEAMTRDGDSYSFTLTSGPPQWDASDVGSHEVVVLAGRGDAVAERSAGTIEVRANCPKD